jgi:hypothetical protein
LRQRRTKSGRIQLLFDVLARHRQNLGIEVQLIVPSEAVPRRGIGRLQQRRRLQLQRSVALHWSGCGLALHRHRSGASDPGAPSRGSGQAETGEIVSRRLTGRLIRGSLTLNLELPQRTDGTRPGDGRL